MDSLIDPTGRVNHGCFDGPIQFNPEDFRLRDFFGRELGPLRRRMAWGAFNYLGFLAPGCVVGLAAIKLGYLSQTFVFHFDRATGKVTERSTRCLPSRLGFELNPDESRITFEGREGSLRIEKSHARSTLAVEADFGELKLRAALPFGFDRHPLRVVNPSCGDPRRFTFTEKCAPLSVERFELSVGGVSQAVDPARTRALYDWSAGYFNRHTNWLWAAFAGVSEGVEVGANFAALVNESFYPENAFWIEGERTRLHQVIFRFDDQAPYAEPWKIFTEDGRVDLRFKPLAERGEKVGMPFLKANFRQFMGEYSGWLRDGHGREIELKELPGLAEIHLSVW